MVTAQPGKRTVCEMLTGAALSRVRPHDRAHRQRVQGSLEPGPLVPRGRVQIGVRHRAAAASIELRVIGITPSF